MLGGQKYASEMHEAYDKYRQCRYEKGNVVLSPLGVIIGNTSHSKGKGNSSDKGYYLFFCRKASSLITLDKQHIPTEFQGAYKVVKHVCRKYKYYEQYTLHSRGDLEYRYYVKQNEKYFICKHKKKRSFLNA